MDLREVGSDPGDWIDLAEDKDQWRVYVKAVRTSGFPKSQLIIIMIIIMIIIIIIVNLLLRNPGFITAFT